MTFLLLDIAPILLIALPMTLVIVTGEIDLSVASVVGLSSVLLGMLVDARLVGAGRGARRPASSAWLCGALNGFLVAYVGLPSLAVTIGTLALFRGHRRRSCSAPRPSPTSRTSGPTSPRQTIGETGIPLVDGPVRRARGDLHAGCCTSPRFGRGVYDIGLNTEAAHFTGVTVARTKFMLFLLSGVVSALAGIYFTLRFGSCPRRQRHRPRAPGDRGGPARRRLDLRRPRQGSHGVIAGVLLIGVISSALRLRGRHGQRHQHHHRAAARAPR